MHRPFHTAGCIRCFRNTEEHNRRSDKPATSMCDTFRIGRNSTAAAAASFDKIAAVGTSNVHGKSLAGAILARNKTEPGTEELVPIPAAVSYYPSSTPCRP